ncbi:hypothetical protein ACYPKM_01380 [Pseudomonas aeruginosa]
MTAKTRTATEVAAFIDGLRAAGISISKETELKERLVKAKDPEMELIRLGSGGDGCIIRFTADRSAPQTKLVKVFNDIGFDGFCYKGFVELLHH